MRVRQPVNYFSVNEVCVNIVGFEDLDLPLSLGLKLFYSLDPECIVYEAFTSATKSTCLTTIQILQDISSITHAALQQDINCTANVIISADASATLANELHRLTLGIPITDLSTSIISNYALAYQRIKPIDFGSNITLVTELGEVVRDVSILEHFQWIDSEFGIPTRLNVAPLPIGLEQSSIKFRVWHGVGVLKNVAFPFSIKSTTALDTQRVRTFALRSALKVNALPTGIRRSILIKFYPINATIHSVSQPNVNFSLSKKHELISSMPNILAIPMRNGSPSILIKYLNYSGAPKYGVIVVPYVEDI